jgi:hypothetical protein
MSKKHSEIERHRVKHFQSAVATAGDTNPEDVPAMIGKMVAVMV